VPAWVEDFIQLLIGLTNFWLPKIRIIKLRIKRKNIYINIT